ncbi:hypothetical protein AC138_09190 [Pseudomonas putida]|nr:hypothetical protein AC138_09190 [Pseudomonas putida]KMY28637.1 hypothetical protein AA993_22650 [Pseudomonas putida]
MLIGQHVDCKAWLVGTEVGSTAFNLQCDYSTTMLITSDDNLMYSFHSPPIALAHPCGNHGVNFDDGELGILANETFLELVLAVYHQGELGTTTVLLAANRQVIPMRPQHPSYSMPVSTAITEKTRDANKL